MSTTEESLDDYAFSGPLSLKQIRKILSMTKTPEEIGKRASIEVSQPSRTIYSESPAIDYLIRMQLADKEEMELNSSFIEKYLKDIPTSSNQGDLDAVGDIPTSNFIEQLSEVLHLNDSEQDSLIVISDEEEHADEVNCSIHNMKTENNSTDETFKSFQNETFNNSIIYIDDEEEIEISRPNYIQKQNLSLTSNEDHKQLSYVHAEQNLSLPSNEDAKQLSYVHIEQNSEGFSGSSAEDRSEQEDEEITFDDTLEEIQMALKFGLDYLMPSEHGTEKRIEKDLSENKIISPTQPQIVKNEHYQKSPATIEFKQPTHRVPTTSKTLNFKNVVSPVGIYIKSSRCPIMENAKNKNVKTLFVREPSATTQTNKENVLPKVMYKPPRRVIKTTQPSPKLPSNIKKLLPPPAVVIKHQGRLLKKNDSELNEKLLSSDLSIQANSSQLDSSVPLNEISVHCKKETFIL